MSLSDLMGCSYGTAAMIVESAGVDEKPVVDDKFGETARDVSLKVKAYVIGESAADLQAKLEAAYEDLRNSGRDFALTGLGGSSLYSLAAAVCFNGAPHVAWTAKPGNSPLRWDFDLSITAQRQKDASGGGSGQANRYTITTKRRPDELREISRNGKLTGINAADTFLKTKIPEWEKLYPDGKWVTSSTYEASTDANQSQVTYTLSAVELEGTLPSSATIIAYDGEITTATEIDEQFRKLITTTVDILFSGPASDLLQIVRPAGDILRESVGITSIKEKRLQASFTVLASQDGTPILNWTSSLRIVPESTTYEEKNYPGADPVMVKRPTRVKRMIQTGTVICQGKFLKARNPFYPNRLLEPPEEQYESVNRFEKRTSWNYQMWLPKDFKFEPGLVDRATDPAFFGQLAPK